MGLASGTNASCRSLRSMNAKSNSKRVHSLMNPLRKVCQVAFSRLSTRFGESISPFKPANGVRFSTVRQD
jgi:hypothetical protein